MSDKDADYYRVRLAAEQAAADSATCPTARAAHQDLAELYQQLLAGHSIGGLARPANDMRTAGSASLG